MTERSRLDWRPYLEAPQHILRGLRAVDHTAELVHVRGPRWWLGCWKPNSHARGTALKILENARRSINWKVWKITQERGKAPTVRLDSRTADRLNLALLALQGFRITAEYSCPTGPQWDMVEDFERMDWCYRHVTDAELFAVLDGRHEAALAEARKDLADPARGRAAYTYMFTSSHLVRRTEAPRSSARRLVKTI